ncbi:F-box domain-containing protein [Mycena kentingensis (nom. inval.)]|nr:F-box domain-containing protein [Mycena kentingensis (nom. inval.)]
MSGTLTLTTMRSFAHSPFNNKEDSFFAPNNVEIAEIRDLLVGPIAESARLDSKIAEMEATLMELKARRDALNAGIATSTHQSLLAPIRRISQHVLEKIFLACLPTAHNAVIAPSEAPLLLGRVCRYWRELAYNTPTLWNRIHISALENSNPTSRRQSSGWGGTWSQGSPNTPPPATASSLYYVDFFGYLERWIARSASAPLDLSYYQSQHYYRDPSSMGLPSSQSAARLIPLVQNVTHRLRSIDIRGDAQDWTPILNMQSSELPSLRGLRLANLGGLNLSSANLRILGHPLLENLDVQGIATPQDLPCNWGNLVELRLHCISDWRDNIFYGGLSVTVAYDLLLQCSRLKTCRMQIITPGGFAGTPSRPLELLHLEELSLALYANSTHERPENWHSHNIPLLIQALRAPALRLLYFGDTYSFDNFPQPELEARISSAPLAVLFMTPVLSADARVDILRATPAATSLVLLDAYSGLQEPTTTPDPNMTCEGLFTRINDEGLCLRLDALHITVMRSILFHTGLIPFLESRRSQGAAMSLRVFVESGAELDVGEALANLGRDGLELALEYRSVELYSPPPTPAPAQWRYSPRDGLSAY